MRKRKNQSSGKKLFAAGVVVGGIGAAYLGRHQLIKTVPIVKRHLVRVKPEVAKAATKAGNGKRLNELQKYIKANGGVHFRRIRGKIVPIRYPKP